MAYKIPDRKAPRNRPKSVSIMSTTELMKFRTKHPEYVDLTLKDFSDIIRAFNSEVINTATSNRDGVVLPENIGRLSIITFSRPKKKIVDFGTSNKTGILSFFKNWNTDNRLCKIMYNSTVKKYGNKNSRFYGFLPTREFKKEVSLAVNKNWQKYVYFNNKIDGFKDI
jgi:transcriptional antiterminator